MRVADVTITEMNVNEKKSFTFTFGGAFHLIQQIDDAIDNTTWQKEGSQNFEIVVTDEEQFNEYEYEMLQDEGIIFGY
jgi:hypothetical protein